MLTNDRFVYPRLIVNGRQWSAILVRNDVKLGYVSSYGKSIFAVILREFGVSQTKNDDFYAQYGCKTTKVDDGTKMDQEAIGLLSSNFVHFGLNCQYA